MDRPETEVVDCDVLIVGGGMSGCATNIWRPHAVGQGGVFFGAAIPSVLALIITG